VLPLYSQRFFETKMAPASPPEILRTSLLSAVRHPSLAAVLQSVPSVVHWQLHSALFNHDCSRGSSLLSHDNSSDMVAQLKEHALACRCCT
jgi:HrpA-like RNA helicase